MKMTKFRSDDSEKQKRKPIKKSASKSRTKSESNKNSQAKPEVFWKKFEKKSGSEINEKTEKFETRSNSGRKNSEDSFGSEKKTEFKNKSIEKNSPNRFSKSNTSSTNRENPKRNSSSEPMRLNKFIAHCGICSRRDAAELVKNGEVKLNGEVFFNPAYEVQAKDTIEYKGKKLRPEIQKIYLLLNKPKNVVTTASDDKGRKTVMDLIQPRYMERLYPVGRLDRNTTGLLLLTNDGDLAQKLSHPSYNVKKIYHVVLDKNLTDLDFEKIIQGVLLEDGKAQVDSLDFVEGNRKEIGITIHLGKNRIVRRIFEHLGYEVIKLDRVYYAGLTKKNIPRGEFRELTEKEIIMLKHFT